MNSTWLPFALAFLSGFFALAGGWLNGTQARRREVRDRDARRAERRYDLRSDLYTKVELQMESFGNAAARAAGPDELSAALSHLRSATVPVVFQSRDIAQNQVRTLLATAERLAGPVARLAATSPDRAEAVEDLRAARAALLDAFAADLDKCL